MILRLNISPNGSNLREFPLNEYNFLLIFIAIISNQTLFVVQMLLHLPINTHMMMIIIH